MRHSLSKLLILYAQQFEDQQAPQNMTIALREAADTITRFTAENEKLRAALEEIANGKYSGIVLTSFPPQDHAVNRARAALEGKQ